MAEQRYEPWGGVRWQDGVMPTDFGHTGQRAEAFGLLDYNARYYSPMLQRFISADSLVPNPGAPQALNRYAHAGNNPLRYRDPSGHWLCEDIDCKTPQRITKPFRPYQPPVAPTPIPTWTPTAMPTPTPTWTPTSSPTPTPIQLPIPTYDQVMADRQFDPFTGANWQQFIDDNGRWDEVAAWEVEIELRKWREGLYQDLDLEEIAKRGLNNPLNNCVYDSSPEYCNSAKMSEVQIAVMSRAQYAVYDFYLDNMRLDTGNTAWTVWNYEPNYMAAMMETYPDRFEYIKYVLWLGLPAEERERMLLNYYHQGAGE